MGFVSGLVLLDFSAEAFYQQKQQQHQQQQPTSIHPIPQVQQVSTYDDATFVSYDWPTHKIGIQNGNQGYLTNNNVAYQHYKIVQGLCNSAGTISFESVANPGQFLRHRFNRIYLDKHDNSDLYRSDACFFPRYNKYFTGYTAYESVNNPNLFIRHANFILYLNNDDGSDLFKKGASWKTAILKYNKYQHTKMLRSFLTTGQLTR